MEQRINDRHLEHLEDENKRCEDLMYCETRDIIADLKDARAEIERLNHKIEILQGPGEGT
jgi:hypothetical protein